MNTPVNFAKDQDEYSNSRKRKSKSSCHISDYADINNSLLQAKHDFSKFEEISNQDEFCEHSKPLRTYSVPNKHKRTKILNQSNLSTKSSDKSCLSSVNMHTLKNHVSDANDLIDRRLSECLKYNYKIDLKGINEHTPCVEKCPTELYSEINFIPTLCESSCGDTPKKTPQENPTVMRSPGNNVIETWFNFDENLPESNQQINEKSLKNVQSKTSLAPKRCIFRKNSSSSVSTHSLENSTSNNCDLSDCCLTGSKYISQSWNSSATLSSKMNRTEKWLRSIAQDTPVRNTSVWLSPNDVIDSLHEGNKNSIKSEHTRSRINRTVVSTLLSFDLYYNIS